MKKHKFSDKLPDADKQIFAKVFGTLGVFETYNPRTPRMLKSGLIHVKSRELVMRPILSFIEEGENVVCSRISITGTRWSSTSNDWWADPQEED